MDADRLSERYAKSRGQKPDAEPDVGDPDKSEEFAERLRVASRKNVKQGPEAKKIPAKMPSNIGVRG